MWILKKYRYAVWFLQTKKSYKYGISYKDDDSIIKPLHKVLPETSTHVKRYDDETKQMYFSFEDDNFSFLSKDCSLEIYYNIWNKVSNSIKKELDCEPINNKKFLKTKIRSYGGEAADFHNKERPKAGFKYNCLEVILIDFVLKKDKNYYPQAFLNDCKYIEKEKKTIRHIADDLKFSSDDCH